MFGVQEQQKQESEPHQIQAPTATAEEEALKRNTDCVYFLASPLTCKKGSECEYRHSDVARVNPRDCWYWLNGNCLNPKCAFRHPPLDGLLGAQAPTPVGPPLPSASAAQGPYAPGKQAVPCIFFQKGYCLKGDACPFMHAPYSANFKIAQSASATLVTETIPHKKTFGVLQKCTQEEKVIQNNVPKSAELPPPAKPVNRVETAPLRNGVAANKIVPKPKFSDDELPRYKPAIIHSAGNGNSVNSKSNRNQQFLVPDDQSILNSKDADDFSREPSPGFDVLVDNELSDSEYYHNEDQFGGHEGRNLNPANDYDIGRSSDYNSMAEVDRDMYRDSRNYDSFDHRQGHYGREERRASSERVSERRRYPRADSPNRIDESDLRHHLSKQKRSYNGLRSVISRDHAHVEDRSYRAPRRDHIPAHESSVSSRLRGRIKIPGRSTSPVNNNDSWSERERHRGRLSSPERERPHGVRFGDRIKGRVQEDFNNEGRNFQGGPRIRRDIVEDDNNNVEFSGPKRLAELKTGRTSESYEQQMNDRLLLGKRKYPVQQDDGDIAFEGPKPLSEILKRKRGEVHNNPKEVKESLPTKEESKPEQNVKSTEGQTSLQNNNVSEVEIGEEGAIGEAAMEDHGLEAYDKREGESEFYEQADGEEYNLEEGENVDLEEEYFEEDDDADDFAKKMGVMYS